MVGAKEESVYGHFRYAGQNIEILVLENKPNIYYWPNGIYSLNRKNIVIRDISAIFSYISGNETNIYD